MNKARKIGLSLVMIGFFIPSILYPFAVLTEDASSLERYFAIRGATYDSKLRDLEVVFVEGRWVQGEIIGKSAFGGGDIRDGYDKGRIAIPYHYLVALCIALVFIGISIIAFSRKEKIKLLK